jgi:hypothetical protein
MIDRREGLLVQLEDFDFAQLGEGEVLETASLAFDGLRRHNDASRQQPQRRLEMACGAYGFKGTMGRLMKLAVPGVRQMRCVAFW